MEMGYLEQTAVSGSSRTVWEEARSRMTELIEAEAAIDAASEAASAGVTLLPTQRCSMLPDVTLCRRLNWPSNHLGTSPPEAEVDSHSRSCADLY